MVARRTLFRVRATAARVNPGSFSFRQKGLTETRTTVNLAEAIILPRRWQS